MSGQGGRSVLVVKLGAFGDFILAQAAFSAIRRHHSGDRLVLLTIPSLAGLGRASGLFDEVWEDPRDRSIGAYLEVRRRIRAGRFARVYDLQCQSRTERYFWLLAPGPWPEWSGTARGCSHPDRYPGRRQVHAVDRWTRQLRPFGIEVPATPDVSWIDADITRFGLDGPAALLVPGSSPHRPEKRWPVERYAELARSLAASGLRPVVIGAPDEAPLGASIRAACPEAMDLTGSTGLPDIAALARAASLAIGNDTGPMHLIAAAGCPALVLFSHASNPDQCAPRGARVGIVRRPALSGLAVDEVLGAVNGIFPLSSGAGPA